MAPHQQPPISAIEHPGAIDPDEITIGILAALPVEGAAMAKLIENLQPFEADNDPNTYRIGSIPSKYPHQPHRVALAVLPHDGTRFAAMMCTNLLRTFGQIRCVIMMGIAGGIPRPQVPAKHVRLGDVVVASRGIVDFGHVRQTDGRRRLRRSDGQISSRFVRAANELQLKEFDRNRPWERWLDPELCEHAREYPRPADETDRLYVRGNLVPHPDLSESGHTPGSPKIHYGAIASSDVLMRDELARDDLAAEFDELLAVEMEGSGIAASTAGHDVPWFMVRGVTDYCERTGKNDVWHRYASYATAAYLRALLEECRPYPTNAQPLFQDGERTRIASLLSRLPEMDLRSACEAAAAPVAEIPSDALTDVLRAFDYLSTLNADPSGLPPALAFVDELAREVPDGRLAAELHHWVDARARAIHAGDALSRWRSKANQPHSSLKAKPCLLVEISLEGIDHDSYRIHSWIQERSGSWRPRPGPGDAKYLALGDAEAFVGDLVDKAEQEWRTATETVAIEFLLPTGLLSLPVEWWRPRSVDENHPPLCVGYEVVVRSLDRMRDSGNRTRMWNRRWSALLTEPVTMKVHWGEHPDPGTDKAALGAWDLRMHADADVALVVLSGPPERSPGREELGMALRAGVPVILWDRREDQPPDAADTMRELIGQDPHLLPVRTKRLRVDAATAPVTGGGGHPGWTVVLLWDDPGRVVEARRAA